MKKLGNDIKLWYGAMEEICNKYGMELVSQYNRMSIINSERDKIYGSPTCILMMAHCDNNKVSKIRFSKEFEASLRPKTEDIMWISGKYPQEYKVVNILNHRCILKGTSIKEYSSKKSIKRLGSNPSFLEYEFEDSYKRYMEVATLARKMNIEKKIKDIGKDEEIL